MESQHTFLYNRVLKTDPKFDFSLVSWNILNSILADPAVFPKIDPKYLDFEFRKKGLAVEMESFIKAGIDVVCLQEVNKNDVDFFRSCMPGYDYSFKHKLDDGFDGLLVLYNKERLDLMETHMEVYVNPETQKHYTQVYQILLFKIKGADNYAMAVTTHLKAADEKWAIRVQEVTQLLESIDEKVKRFKKLYGNKKLGVVVCGDMNDYPDSKCISLFREAKYGDAYPGVSYTSFSVRDIPLKKALDFIFYRGDLELVANLDIPDNVIDDNGLPNNDYPSDHLSLIAGFVYK